MRPEAQIGIFIISVLSISYIVYRIKEFKPTPDPWEKLPEKEKPDIDTEESNAICPNCFTPVKPFEHYCSKCNNITGNFTRYLPFLNIRFNYSIFASILKNISGKNPSLLSRFLYLIFLFFAVFPAVIIGFPFLIFEWLRKFLHKNDKHDEPL